MADDKPKKLSDIGKGNQPTPESKPNDSNEKAKDSGGKKKFSLKLPKLSLRKKSAEPSEKAEKKSEEKPIEPMSPQDLVNSLDGQIKILDETDEEYLNKQLDHQLDAVKKNSVTISVTKKQFMRWFGIVVIVSWLVPLGYLAFTSVKKIDFSSFRKNSKQDEASASAELANEASLSARMIRIKTSNSEAESISKISQLLKDSLLYESVDVLETDIEETLLTVITKADTSFEVATISSVLGEEFPISTSSASLESESSYSALLIIPN